MHSWDMMPPTNYDHNWCTTQTMPTIKSEPQDITNINPYGTDHKMPTESNPTSPQSMDSGDSTHHAAYYAEQLHGMTANLHAQNMHRPLGFNPLTPPGYPNAMIPTPANIHHTSTGQTNLAAHNQLQHQTTPYRQFIKESSHFPVNTASLTPSHTPPMDDTPPKSPKYLNETPEKDIDNLSNISGDGSMDSEDDDNIRTPKVNSHGKVKTFKCKQCDFVAVTKMTFWDHTKAHIKPEKMLKCLKCPFVTEYKHHLEYHLRNHDGSKPFQCNKCSYSCVNKSMLNSHLKSHSNIYQYRCDNCSYATKYCHSLKLHLRKYEHKPAMVLNQDGSPNPLPIIDVYGTRRGPKNRSGKRESNQQRLQNALAQQSQKSSQQQQQHQHQAQQKQQFQNMLPTMLPNPFANMLNFPYLNLNFQMLAAQQQAALAQFSPNMDDSKSHTDDDDDLERDMDDCDDEDIDMPENNNNDHQKNTDCLDLSSPSPRTPTTLRQFEESNDEKITTSTSMEDIEDEHLTKHNMQDSPLSTPSSSKNRRKGRAFKLDMMKENEQNEEEIHRFRENKNAEHQMENTTNTKSNLNGSEASNNLNISINPPQSPSSSSISTTTAAATVTEKKQPEDASKVQSSASPATTTTTTTASTSTTSSSFSAQHIYECKYCDIAFKDVVLHTIHMGYHGYNDVFKCNMCGEKCDDCVSFFLHIARNSHS